MPGGYHDIKINYKSNGPDFRAPNMQTNILRDMQDLMRTRMAMEQSADLRFEKTLTEQADIYGIKWKSEGAKAEFESLMSNIGVGMEEWENVNFENPAEVRSFRLKIKQAVNNPRAEELIAANEYLGEYEKEFQRMNINGKLSNEAKTMGTDLYNNILDDPNLFGNTDYLRKLNPVSLVEIGYYKDFLDINKYDKTITPKLYYRGANGKDLDFSNIKLEEVSEVAETIVLEENYEYDPKHVKETIENTFKTNANARRSFLTQASLGMFGEELKELAQDNNNKLEGDDYDKAVSVLHKDVMSQLKKKDSKTHTVRDEAQRLSLLEQLKLLPLQSKYEKAKINKLINELNKTEATQAGVDPRAYYLKIKTGLDSSTKHGIYFGDDMLATALNINNKTSGNLEESSGSLKIKRGIEKEPLFIGSERDISELLLAKSKITPNTDLSLYYKDFSLKDPKNKKNTLNILKLLGETNMSIRPKDPYSRNSRIGENTIAIVGKDADKFIEKLSASIKETKTDLGIKHGVSSKEYNFFFNEQTGIYSTLIAKIQSTRNDKVTYQVEDTRNDKRSYKSGEQLLIPFFEFNAVESSVIDVLNFK